jgi:hypothetical protein
MKEMGADITTPLTSRLGSLNRFDFRYNKANHIE